MPGSVRGHGGRSAQPKQDEKEGDKDGNEPIHAHEIPPVTTNSSANVRLRRCAGVCPQVW